MIHKHSVIELMWYQ